MMKKNILKLSILLFTVSLLLHFGNKKSVRSIEIPLESFGQGTTIAYVNMHKIFEAFPETEKARVELTDLIEKRKSEITKKREEIAQLKSEIGYLKRQFSAVDPSVEAKPKRVIESITPKEPVEKSTQVLTLPEKSPLKFLFEPPENSTGSLFGDPNQQSYSTFTTRSPQILPGVPSPAPKLKEKEAELLQKESDLSAFIGAAESEIKRIQEGKTMTLMASIYRSLEDIAKNEGYTIIVDKENILFGQNTVDITESVIWRLNSPRNRRR